MSARRRPRLRTWRAAAAALALLAVAGCGSGSGGSGTGSGSGTSAANAGTVKIGLLVSLSGVYQAVGTDLRDGFQLYLDTHGGTLGGRSIQLVVGDEGDGPATAVPAAMKMVKQDHVMAVTGLVGGGSVAAVAPLLTKQHIPLIGSNARPKLADDSYVWTTSFMSQDPGTAIAPYVAQQIKGPVYAIGPDYQGGYDELNGFTDAFTKAGGKLADPNGKTTYTPFPQTTDFTPYFNQIKNSGAKAVYTFYAGAPAIAFVKQYAQSDIAKLPLYSAFITEGGVLQAEGPAAQSIYSVMNYSPDLDNAVNRTFVAAWESAHHTQPSTFATASYDAAAVLDKAIAAAGGNLTPDTLNAAVRGLGQIQSPRGTWQFGPQTHAPVQEWYLRQVRADGRALSNVLIQNLATVGN